MVDKGILIGPNGMDFYKEPIFKLPEGLVAFCHVHNIGFKTLEEERKHAKEWHDSKKNKVK